MSLGKSFVKEMTWKEFEEATSETDLGLVPCGVLEAHGLHGPLGFDTYISQEIAERLSSRIRCLVFPPVEYSSCHLRYDARMWPGTLSLSPETILGLYVDVGCELHRMGLKRIMFVNSHAPNTPILELAMSRIADSRVTVAIGLLEWWSAAAPVLAKLGRSDHGGKTESSIFLATKSAGLMDLSKAVSNPMPGPPSLSAEEAEIWREQIRFTRRMDSRYLQTSGNYGEAREAKREIGEQVIEATVERGVKLAKVLEENLRNLSTPARRKA